MKILWNLKWILTFYPSVKQKQNNFSRTLDTFLMTYKLHTFDKQSLEQGSNKQTTSLPNTFIIFIIKF